MTSDKMDNLKLGMTKDQVVSILGKNYTIAEKRVDNGVGLEILSYRSFYKDDEFYMFVFANDKLERWYRDLLPKYETAKSHVPKLMILILFAELLVVQFQVSLFLKYLI